MRGWPKGKKNPGASKWWKENNPMHCPESRNKISGENNPTKRLEVREKMSASQKGKKNLALCGDKNPMRKYPNLRRQQSDYMKNGGATHARSFNRSSSKLQIQLFERVKILYPFAVLEYPYQNFYIDIAIPEYKIAIEFDGEYWHLDKDADRDRQSEIEKGGWRFCRYSKLPDDNQLNNDLTDLQHQYQCV